MIASSVISAREDGVLYIYVLFAIAANARHTYLSDFEDVVELSLLTTTVLGPSESLAVDGYPFSNPPNVNGN